MPPRLKDWLRRHAGLTREERTLLALIVFIVLCGVAVRACGRAGPGGTVTPGIEAPAP